MTSERKGGLIKKPPHGFRAQVWDEGDVELGLRQKRRWPRNALGLQHAGLPEDCRPETATTQARRGGPAALCGRETAQKRCQAEVRNSGTAPTLGPVVGSLQWPLYKMSGLGKALGGSPSHIGHRSPAHSS